MSKFARSLLALAVLFAAADASNNCNSVLFGVVTTDQIGFKPAVYPSGGGELSIENACQTQQRRMLAGELVTACNYNQNGVPPNIFERTPPQASPVDVSCPDGCPGGGVATIVQYCY